MKRNSLAIAILVSGTLIFLLQRVVGLDWPRILALLGDISLPMLGAIWLTYQLFLYLKALRLRLLLNYPISQMKMWGVVMIYQLMTTTMPFRTGDVTLLPLLKGHGVPMAGSLAVLLLAKLVEVVAILLNFFVILILFKGYFVEYGTGLWQAGLVSLVVLLVAVGVLLGMRHKGGPWLLFFLAGRGWLWLPRRAWLLDRLTVFQEGMSHCSYGTLGWAVGLALLARPLNTVVVVLFFAAVAPQWPWQLVVVGEMWFFLLSQLPLNGLFGVGSFHALFVLVFSGLGMAAQEALALSVALHGVSLLLNGISGMQGVLLDRWRLAGGGS